jgi:hypothetical protein
MRDAMASRTAWLCIAAQPPKKSPVARRKHLAMLRLRNVNPGSWLFPIPGFRIQQQKREGKNFFTYLPFFFFFFFYPIFFLLIKESIGGL